MVVSVFLYPVLYGLELFLASALITQIAVSLAAVVVSTVTIYYCRQQLVHWHQERVVRKRGRWRSDVSIKTSKKQRDSDHSESSEGELSDLSLLRRIRAGLRSRSHDHSKTKTSLESGEETSLKSSQKASSEGVKKDTPESGRVRPKLTKQVGAMHRSHWVAKPQQSLSTGRRRSSESEAELRGGGNGAGLDPQTQEDRGVTMATEVKLDQTGGRTLKRSRATARMTLKKHPRFSSSDSSSSASPASSSAESDDLVHGESREKADCHTDSTAPTRRVPSIQVEPIVEERIVPLGRHGSSLSPPSSPGRSTKKEISTLEFSLAVVESQPQSYEEIHESAASRDIVSVDAQSPSVTVSASAGAAADAAEDVQTHKDGRELSGHTAHTSEKAGSSTERRELLKSPGGRLDVPPVITGEVAYPKRSFTDADVHPSAFVRMSRFMVDGSEKPLVVESKIDLDYLSQPDGGDKTDIPLGDDSSPPSPHSSSDITRNEGKRMDSLDVPPTITGEVCFPPLMLSSTKGLTQQEVDEDQATNGQSSPTRKIVKIRPKSLDIPPMLPGPYPRSAESAPPSPPSGAGHGVKRKHGSAKSILKRSGSMERPGRKKSVSFSPEVSPREFEVERCYDGDADLEHRDLPKRPRVFRHFSMDIPDARVASDEDALLSSSQGAWSHGDSDDGDQPDAFSPPADSGKLSRAEGWVHPSPLEPMQLEGSDARMAFVPICALESDESGRKSAKERFLEAGGAKAVLSVLCTQDSNDSNGSKYLSPPEVKADAAANDGSEEDSMETMPDIDQPLSVSAEVDDDHPSDESAPLREEVAGQETDKTTRDQADGKGIKSRFLEYKEDSADIHTSRLFVETVRSSVESDSSDELERSPGQQQAGAEGKVETGEFEEDAATSAKSRFLQSCQDVDGDGKPRNGSRFVVSVVRSYTPGSHKQDSPSHDAEENKEAGEKQVWNREVPGGSNGNTWRNLLEQELSEDIEFYESELKSAEDAKPKSVSDTSSRLSRGEIHSSDSSESDTDAVKTGISSEHHLHSYSSSTPHLPNYSENAAVVIDNGSEMIKVGFAGDLRPRFTVPAVVGRYASDSAPDPAAERTAYIGREATKRRHLLCLDYPTSEGVVRDWDDLQQIWEYLFTSLLNVRSHEHPLLISEYASTTKKQRGKCLEVLFENLQVPSLCLANQGALALQAQGDTSGVVLSSGGGLTEVIPVLDGRTVQYAVTTLEVAGRQVTRHLGNLLQSERGYNMTSPSNMEILRDIKETMAYVCMDTEREIQRVRHLEPVEYKLPDGSSLAVGHQELFQCTEQLFQPSLGGFDEQSGIHDMIQATLKRCDPTVLAGIRKSILLAGGNTQLRGFGDRLQLELASAHLPWSVSMPQNRTDSVWIGGSVVGSHGDFSHRCINAGEYAEHGASALHRKCF